MSVQEDEPSGNVSEDNIDITQHEESGVLTQKDKSHDTETIEDNISHSNVIPTTTGKPKKGSGSKNTKKKKSTSESNTNTESDTVLSIQHKRNDILQNIQNMYNMKAQNAGSGQTEQKLSLNEMWGILIGERVGGLSQENCIKMKMYIELLVSSCELEVWEPPSPLHFLDMLHFQNVL